MNTVQNGTIDYIGYLVGVTLIIFMMSMINVDSILNIVSSTVIVFRTKIVSQTLEAKTEEGTVRFNVLLNYSDHYLVIGSPDGNDSFPSTAIFLLFFNNKTFKC